MPITNQDMLNKEETKAQAEADKAEADTNLEGVLSELQMLANKSADLHSSCDFILKNFDIRQSSRDEEVKKTCAGISSIRVFKDHRFVARRPPRP